MTAIEPVKDGCTVITDAIVTPAALRTVMDASGPEGEEDLRVVGGVGVTVKTLDAVIDWIDPSAGDVGLLVDDRMLIAYQGQERMAWDTGGERASSAYLKAHPVDRYRRVRYGQERFKELRVQQRAETAAQCGLPPQAAWSDVIKAMTRTPCRECGARRRQLHHLGCAAEECPRCDTLLTSCPCPSGARPDDHRRGRLAETTNAKAVPEDR